MSTDETYKEVMNPDISKKMMELILKWRDAAAGYNHHGEHCAAHGFEECAHDLEVILPDIPHNQSLKADKVTIFAKTCPDCGQDWEKYGPCPCVENNLAP